MGDPQRDPDAARALAVAEKLRATISRLKRRLRRDARTNDLTLSQLSVLARLEREAPTTVTALARAEGVRSQSMGATVAALEAAGLVRGSPDPDDGRQTLLSLTSACRKLIADRRAAKQDWLFRAIRAHLTRSEQAQLAAALELLDRIVDA